MLDAGTKLGAEDMEGKIQVRNLQASLKKCSMHIVGPSSRYDIGYVKLYCQFSATYMLANNPFMGN